MKIQEVEAAVDRYFADTSRSQSETKMGLIGLREHIDVLIENLDDEEE